MNNTAAPKANFRSARPAAWYAKAIASAMKQADAYRQLAALATTLGMEYEADRMTADAAEMDYEVESLIERACFAGYTPEDIEVG